MDYEDAIKIVWKALEATDIPEENRKQWDGICEAMELLKSASEELHEFNHPNDY